MSDIIGGSIIWNLGVDSSKLSSGLKSARAEIESTAKDSKSRLKSLDKSFSDVGKKMSLAVTAPVVAIGTASFKMEYESFLKEFEIEYNERFVFKELV